MECVVELSCTTLEWGDSRFLSASAELSSRQVSIFDQHQHIKILFFEKANYRYGMCWVTGIFRQSATVGITGRISHKSLLLDADMLRQPVSNFKHRHSVSHQRINEMRKWNVLTGFKFLRRCRWQTDVAAQFTLDNAMLAYLTLSNCKRFLFFRNIKKILSCYKFNLQRSKIRNVKVWEKLLKFQKNL